MWHLLQLNISQLHFLVKTCIHPLYLINFSTMQKGIHCCDFALLLSVEVQAGETLVQDSFRQQCFRNCHSYDHPSSFSLYCVLPLPLVPHTIEETSLPPWLLLDCIQLVSLKTMSKLFSATCNSLLLNKTSKNTLLLITVQSKLIYVLIVKKTMRI